ncbi:hypothetical protein B0O80DRAFT_380404 [Mortierella sp. GBAus27b]|nr:hypothetical protein B0O80DRAFT_380404 [Mortierella sp. GBAus27b]
MGQLLVDSPELSELWKTDRFAWTVHHAIEHVSQELRAISMEIHSNPELGYQEFKAHALLTDYLEKKGFHVERKAFGIDTAFVARAGHSDKVTIGICTEYDALPGIGHACGHNLIAISGVAAAIGVKAAIEKFHLRAQVKLFGTPAEESSGGKIVMNERGAFKDVDAIMMLHGGNRDLVYATTLALEQVTVEYFGKASHAASSPWEGINALDAAMMAYTNIGMMRQQLHPSLVVHGIISNGGQAPNIIPEYTSLSYAVRAPKYAQVETLKTRVEKIFRGAAAATGCTIKITWTAPFKGMVYYVITNGHLARKYEHYMNAQGLHYVSKPEQESKPTGSTDMGNLTQEIPGFEPMFNVLNLKGVEDTSMNMHTKEFAVASTKRVAHLATLRAAKGLAMTAVECIRDPVFLRHVKHDFEHSTKC